jgi:topoisomerase IV subunit A
MHNDELNNEELEQNEALEVEFTDGDEEIIHNVTPVSGLYENW